MPNAASFWKAKASAKLHATTAKIPDEWCLPDSILDSSPDVQAVPRTCGILSPEEIIITESHDTSALVKHLTKGTLFSVDVTTSFAKHVAIAQQLTSCLTETFFPRALQRATELDGHFFTYG